MSAVSEAEVFAFEGFSLDPRQRRLFGPDGRSLPLSGRAFDTLLYLVEHPNQLIDKQALMKAVWPNVIVEENNLNQNILIVRRALGEAPGEHRFIVTVPGRGFRFVPAVRRLEGAGEYASATRAASKATEASLAPSETNANGRERAARDEATSSTATATTSVRRSRSAALALITALAVAVLLTGVYALWREHPGATVTSARVEGPSYSGPPANVAPPGAVVFAPPLHSLAVLPFVNMSGDPSQEYFSDGLTEELLNSLSRINELQVAARTSSFSFQGEHPDITTVAHKLNVASVLEGSVRRSGHTVRVTAQLNNAVTGFHIWSQTYDRDLGDVLQLQTEIATAVAEALKVKLLSGVAERIELGGTRSPAAFDAYLRGSKALSRNTDESRAITEYTEAIRLDPSYALAFASRSRALSRYAVGSATGLAEREFFDKALADAREALKLAPKLAEGHLALASYFSRGALDFTHASEAYERALMLAPGNANVLAEGGRFAVLMGRFDAGLAAARRAVALDPLGERSRYMLGVTLHFARRDEEAVAAFGQAISLDPDYPMSYHFRGLSYYVLGDLQSARSSCENKPDDWSNQWCLAVVYHKLVQHADAEAMLKRVLTASHDGSNAFQYALVYAQWGDTTKALEWLTTAMRLHNTNLVYTKSDPLLDPLRNDSRFQAIERQLRFPN